MFGPIERARTTQVTLICSTLLLAWLGMTATHESGHVLNAWLSGGAVARVHLHPLRFSETELSHNPHPAFVAWGGATWGIVLPCAAWVLVGLSRLRFAFVLRFLAGFCLIANGAYLACGSFLDGGDAADLRQHGVPLAFLIGFGVLTVPAGLALWHGLGPRFGFGRARGSVGHRFVC